MRRSRSLRRVAWVSVVAVWLTVAIPPGAVPAGGGFPLDGLLRLFRVSTAWGAPTHWADPDTPDQGRGGPADRAHEVDVSKTRADGGVGGPRGKGVGELDPYEPPQAPAREPQQTPAQATFDPATSQRDAKRSSATMDYYDNADGSVTQIISTGRLNFQDTDGGWAAIDTRLVERPGRGLRGDEVRLESAANDVLVSVAGPRRGTTSGGGQSAVEDAMGNGGGAGETAGWELASVTLPSGEVFGYGMVGARPVSPIVDGSVSRYPGVLPGVDVAMEATATGLKETLVLESAEAGSSWVFPLRLAGLTSSIGEDGSVLLANVSGGVVARIPAGQMWDSLFDPRSGEFTTSSAVRYELVEVDGGPALRVSADEEWLRDPARVYPVYVDPTFSVDTNGDVFVDNLPYGPVHNGDNLPVGTFDGGTSKHRSFVKFQNLGSVAGKNITSAKIRLHHTWSYDCNHHLPVYAYRVGVDWSVSGLANATYPGPTTAGQVGSLTITDNYPACTNTGGDRTVGKWWELPFDASLVNDWLLDSSTNHGLALTASAGDSYAFKRFTSANVSATYAPKLVLTYRENAAPQIDEQYPPFGYTAETLTPELVAVGSDDGYPLPLKYQFFLFDVTGQTPLDQSSLSTKRSWTVPAGKLEWGKTYWWTVKAFDGFKESTSQQPHVLTTQVPQPPITSSLSQNTDGRGFEPAIGNFTTSAVDAQVETVGPALAVQRYYNSRDPRTTGAFGAGWSSLLDAKATEHRNSANVIERVVVTYPTGQEVAFGRNANGTYVPPLGRHATFGTITGGYRLIDKDGTQFAFTKSLGSGRFAITAVTDAKGRVLNLTYSGDQVSTLASAASGRTLSLTWVTPSGTTTARVATVSTDPADPADPTGTVSTWTYQYDGPRLVSVCPPTSSTQCHEYGYEGAEAVSLHPTAVLDQAPRSYLRLGSSSGTISSSAVDSLHTSTATPTNTGTGAGPFVGSTAATFNGSSSYVELPREHAALDSHYQTVSLWFKTPAGSTTGGVLLGLQDALPGQTVSGWVPALYVGTDGGLYYRFYDGTSSASRRGSYLVNDGQWHHVLFVSTPTLQTLYLDGQVGSKATDRVTHVPHLNRVLLGAGRWSGRPATSGTSGYFTGSIAEVALFDRPLTAAEAAILYGTGTASSQPLTSVVRPSGAVAAGVDYDQVSGTVDAVTDANGGVWQVSDPARNALDRTYRSAVLAHGPMDYWRMQETGVTTAINEVNGETLTYNNVLLGVSGGPVDGKPTAEFDGTTSYAKTSTGPSLDSTRSYSVSAWVRLDDLDGDQAVMVMSGSNGGSAFKLRHTSANQWKVEGAGRRPDQTVGWWHVTSAAGMPVAGAWTHLTVTVAVPASGDSTITMYVNGGEEASTTTSVPFNNPATDLRIGYEYSNWWLDGRIGEVATFPAALTAAEVDAIYKARGPNSGGSLVKRTTVTDPTGKTLEYTYDLMAGGRLIQSKDSRGKVTVYGYDVRGFLHTVTDPNGNLTVSGHDVRGNVVSYATCQDRSENRCSTIYLEHWPNNTAATLAPDPRNDVVTKVRDGRSASATDNTYLTTYEYNTAGDVTRVTDPLGRATVTTYSASGGAIPAGLPVSVTSPNGATQTMEYASSGDLTATVDSTGRRTESARDGLGRIIQSTEITDTYSTGLVTSYAYDKASRVVERTEPAVLDRITGAVHTPHITITYDEDGRELTTTIADLTGGDAARTIEKGYNALGQLAWEEDGLGRRISYTYTPYGKVATKTTPDGVTTSYTYDAMGNPLTTTLLGWTGHPSDPQPATDLLLESRAYDPAGRLATVTDAMGWQTKYTYTDNNLLATVVRHDPSTGSSFVIESYKYDGAGNPIEMVTNNGATKTTAMLDAAGRVVSQTVDPTGVNRTSTFSYNAADNVVSHRISDASGASQQVDRLFDSAGRLVGETMYPTTPTPATPLPVGRWRLDESSGLKAADSAGNSPATATVGVTWSTDHGGSAALAGTGDHLATAGPVIDTTRSYSVATWVKLDAGATAGTRTAISQDGPRHSGFKLGYKENVGWRWLLCPPTGGCVALPGGSLTTGTWAHLAGVYDAAANQMRFYIDGAPQGQATVPAGGASASGPLRIGVGRWDGALGDNWSGSVDDVQVYQDALTDSQVQAIYAGIAPAADAEVLRTSWTVDQRGLATSQTDSTGDVTYYDYDEAGRLAVTTHPAAYTETGDGSAPVLAPVVESAAYNTFGEVVESRDANGRHTFAEFDAAGQLTEVWLPPYTPPGSSTPMTPVERTFYDAMGRVVETRDGLNNSTFYGYDQLGRATGVEAADGGITTATYSLTGQMLSVVDPTGARQESTYDFLGRPVTQTQVVRQTGQAYTSTFTYNSAGWLATSTRPGRAATTYSYNGVGEVVRAVDGGANVALFGYDALGRRVSTQRQHASCEPTCADRTTQVVVYDGAGRQVAARQLDASGSVLTQTSVAYSRDSLPVAVTNPRGVTSTYSYDTFGRLTGMVEPVSATEQIATSYGYDPTGNLTRFTDGRGHAYRTTYNPWGLPESQTEPGGVTFTTVYDAAGRAVGSQLPGGVTTTSTYDSVGRLTAMSGAGAEAQTATRTFGYDLAGRMTSLSGPGGTNALTYDDRGLLTSVTGPSGDSSYSYTPDGLLAQRVDAAGSTGYGYDTIGRLAQISNTSAGLQLDYQYDSRSQVSRITYGGATGGNKRLLHYDALGRVEVDELLTSSDALVGRITYAWDENSNLTGKTTVGFTGSAVNSYTYDLADRLTSWNNGTATEAYGYDASGNRTQVGATTFTYNARNQLVSSSDGTTYSYTDRGTLATTNVLGVGTLATESDAFGQVIRQYDTPTTFSEYSYDGLGRVLQAGFEYTGLGNDLATDPTGTYVRGPAGDLVGVDSTYAWTDLHTDVVGQFTATATALTGSTTYRPFGKVLASSGMQGSLGYQSEYTDGLTGRVNMHARWYNPDTGQFDSRDPKTVSPIPMSAAANRYAYAGGNPLVRIDPTGHDFMSGCGSMMSCIVQGFVNSFDLISMAKSAWNALGNIQNTVRSFASSLKSDADRWKGNIRGWLPSRLCGMWAIGGKLCDAAATVGGWACALSGVCDIINDCARAFGSASSRNSCGQHIGEALASVFMGILSGGAAAVGKFMLNNLIRRFHLPDRNNRSNSNSNSLAHQNSRRDAAMANRANNSHRNNSGGGRPSGNAWTNNGGSGGGGGGSSGRPPGAASQPRPPSNPNADRAPTNPAPPAPTAPTPVLRIDISRIDLSRLDRQRSSQAGPSCRTHSFDPDTPVLMADGTTKAIKDVKVGDEVVATDPETSETTQQAVTNLHVNLDRELTTLTLAPVPAEGAATIGEGNGDRSTRGPTNTLETTNNHPFWDVTTSAWVDAGDLVPGQSVVTSPDGQQQLVVAVDNHTGAAEMRDLTVADIHTYYVVAGDTPVLVHNTSPGEESCQLPLFVFKDGEVSSAAERAASVGGNGAFQPVPTALRNDMIQAHIDATPPGQIPTFTCWRCGHATTNPANIHVGHVNVPRVQGGNHNPANLCFEGAACNLSAQNRGSVTPGMSCAERGGCGVPYGRYD